MLRIARPAKAWARTMRPTLCSPKTLSPTLRLALIRSLTVSHVKGPTSPDIYENTIGKFTKDIASQFGDNKAVISVHQNVELTYSELDRKSDIVAVNVARQLNIQPGDRVAVCSGNSWEYPVLQLALAKIGAILVPLNPAFTDTQFHAALNNSQSKALIIQSHLSRGTRKTARDVTGLIKAATQGSLLPHVNKVVILDSMAAPPPDSREHISLDGDRVRPFDSLLKWYSAEQPQDCIELAHLKDDAADHALVNDTINMQFTSGTTAFPKISCLTHRNLVNNGRFIGERMGLNTSDKICTPVPMFHCFGLVLSNLAILSCGAALVYSSETFDPSATLEAIKKHSCTGMHGVPTMFTAELELANHYPENTFNTLSKGIAAGSAVPVELMRTLNEKFNLDKLTICYGMTETAPVSFMTSPSDTLDRRCTTVGTIMPHTEAKVVKPNSDDLTPLPVNTPGEIIISGYLLQSKYHRNKQQTEEAMPVKDGQVWMRTGDEGVLDEHGYLRITGRIKDLIIRGGENIHPLEIENVLFQHPSIAQASVVGVPDGKYGEAVAAFIQLHEEYYDRNSAAQGNNLGIHGVGEGAPTPEEIKDFVKDKLGHYMVPKYVWFVPDFPKTASGKIRKVDLKGTAEGLIADYNEVAK